MAGEASREAMGVERQSKRYWALEFLARHRERSWRAILVRWLREDLRLGLIVLEELGLEMPMIFKELPPPGSRFAVTVGHVDTWEDTIKFRLAEE